MTWWLKIRAVPTLVAGTATTIALGLLIGNAQLPVPAMTGQAGQFLAGHLITLAPAILILFGTGRGDLTAESVSARPIVRWDLSLAVTTAAASLLTATLFRAIWPTDITVVLGRNIAGYIGIALVLLPFLGHRAAGAALAVVPLLCAAVGWGPGGHPEPWAWLLHPGDSVPALTLALGTLAAGITATLTRPPLDLSAMR